MGAGRSRVSRRVRSNFDLEILPLNFPYFEQKVLVLPLMQSRISA